MKKHIQIKNSYKIWKPSVMKHLIEFRCRLDRFIPKSYTPYIIEWWLHNIGYYLTKPFISLPFINKINIRCKDVDLMVKGEKI